MTTAPLDAHHRIDALLLERWDRDPDLPALVSGDTVVTMGELKGRVLRAAAALRARGVGSGDRVVVYHERSVDFVVAMLGVVFAGAAHAAIDVNDPLRRTLRTIDDCAPRALMTSPALRSRFSVVPGFVVVTDEEYAVRRPTPPPPPVTASGEDPAVVIYTSGSTGRPKASLISHRALVSRLTALQSTHRMDEHDRMIHHTVCSFDMYLCELYWPLLAGAAVVIAAPGRQRDADYLAALIRDHRITTFYCVVSLLELFLLTRDPAERYDGIRQVLTGGESLSPELVKRFHARSTASLTNLYGPSECTIYCTAWVCPRDPDLDAVLIGSAIQDTELWILDEAGAPVADGEPGELHIGGAGLALGYLHRPELTAERFVRAPALSPDSRLYRSGDLVRARPDGALEFLGRVDRQVKIRGIRIELGEIEATAVRCAGVRQAAVVAHGSGYEKRLAAYVVAEEGAESLGLPSVVRQTLRTWLPPYMVPTAIEAVDSLPLTANGKLDRLLLEDWTAKRAAIPIPTPIPVPAAVAYGTGVAVAGEDVETVVSEVWCEALGTAGIGPDDDFFDLGGDSFKVVQVVETLRHRLGADIPLAALLHEPTVAGFATELRRLMDTDTDTDIDTNSDMATDTDTDTDMDMDQESAS
ncbi:amino acid adenylation domain-containing protein [Streptomyces sp. NBC_00038]|uniref:amino acid adenylation domain-containing protein n=1 Tax=Streptomyces sp. NBC_00038 TaxID=2903615 RepID=UPI0022592FCB|nr:amino acid adenylation domain-containing protein [Streptomyces sp. NBC_00038]MCX5561676.1 amino acid adenylation domain-containing protein [Streptomyces sp. NBC_00038]